MAEASHRRAGLLVSKMLAAALIAASVVGATADHATAARPLTLGFFDSVFADGDAGVRSLWLDRSRAANARIVRILLRWPTVAPSRPANPTDPADPAYDWSGFDAAVGDAQGRGLAVLASITAAPTWAEGSGSGRGSGSWRPDPHALGQFARAAATRYSGSYRDPRTGAVLPRLRDWMIWNEPNLSTHLSPQGTGTGPRFRPTSPSRFRRMLNASYASIKAVHRDNLVVIGGLAPYGDLAGRRTAPAWFLRELLCLRGRNLRPIACRNPAHFDVLSHHPYAVGSPRRHAFGPDDVSVPDLGKLTRIVRKAVRTGRALPKRRKRLWVTEISWDSRPPDPNGVPAARHARWLADAFRILWRQGVDTITWFQIRDQARGPDWGLTSQSGVFLRDGRAKPALQAFRFPFVAGRARRGRSLVWGKAPGGGTVVVERRAGKRWRSAAHFRVGRNGVFQRRVRAGGGSVLRARKGAVTSRPWGA